MQKYDLVNPLAACMFLLAICVASGASIAAPIPAGYSCTGNCGSLGADGVVTLAPSGNSSYLYVTTNGGATGAGRIPSVGGTNGTLLKTPTFSADAGDALEFYFNFVTSDGAGFSDYAWAALNTSADALVGYLFTARTQPSGDISPGVGLPANISTLTPATSGIIGGGPAWSPLGGTSGLCYSGGCGFTGWIHSSYDMVADGDYYLSFGTTNWLDTAYDTGMAIDGVLIAGVSIDNGTDVPEPGTLGLFGVGLVGLFRAARRRRGGLASLAA